MLYLHLNVLLQKNDLSSKQIQFFYACYENQSSSYYGTVMMYACYAVVQTVGLYLVYKSKNVTSIPSLNDTKSVTALIYISTVCFCVIAFLKFILDGYSDLSNTLSSLMSLVLIASFLGLVFGPKVSYVPCFNIDIKRVPIVYTHKAIYPYLNT